MLTVAHAFTDSGKNDFLRNASVWKKKKQSISETITSPMVWCAKSKTAVSGIDSTIIFRFLHQNEKGTDLTKGKMVSLLENTK